MEVVNLEKLVNLEEKCAVAIGFFDGVHLGHQKVINNAVNYAKENQIKSVVITFDRSPKVALGAIKNEGCLTPTAEKLRILEGLGVDYTLVLKFDTTFLNLSADAFVNDYLLKVKACYVSVGFDFRFGQGGLGNTDLLLRRDEFRVEVSEAVQMDGVKVSTTAIKNCLKLGDLESVNQMLGRHFSVSGEVVKGCQLGRAIGFPTANLKPDEAYLLSLRGVYATISHVDETCFLSMTNIGINPTVNLQASTSIETYIFDFDADIYDKKMRIAFLSKIRDEIKFDSLDALVDQLEKDKRVVNAMLIKA